MDGSGGQVTPENSLDFYLQVANVSLSGKSVVVRKENDN
jgi:hypothetical protein